MQYDAKTPEEYLKLLEPDWRKEKLLAVRKLILKAAPEAVECIEYKMLAYQCGIKNIFHLNAQKDFVGLYVGNIEKVPDSKTLLKDFSTGKGCIRITKDTDIAERGLHDFLRNAMRVWQEGGETEC